MVNYWVWPVSEENWRIVKRDHVWATKARYAVDKVKRNDEIIFYVRGTNSFGGIFKVVGDWYETRELRWEDEVREGRKIYFYEVKVLPVCLNDVNVEELRGKLSFVREGGYPLCLRSVGGGPANNASPISEDDYRLILERMKISKVSKREGEGVSEGVRVSTHKEAQALLLEIGRLLGCDTFVARDSRSKTAYGRVLGEIASLDEVPRFGRDEAVKEASKIDVLWISPDNQMPRYAFRYRIRAILGLI